jgi:hypothetical protein
MTLSGKEQGCRGLLLCLGAQITQELREYAQQHQMDESQALQVRSWP